MEGWKQQTRQNWDVACERERRGRWGWGGGEDLVLMCFWVYTLGRNKTYLRNNHGVNVGQAIHGDGARWEELVSVANAVEVFHFQEFSKFKKTQELLKLVNDMKFFVGRGVSEGRERERERGVKLTY